MTDRKRKNKYTNYGTGKKIYMKPDQPVFEREFPDNYWKDMYGVSVHAIIRYCQRVLEYYGAIDNTLKSKVATVISDELQDKLHPLVSGKFKLLGDYIAVVIDGTVVTIKYKEKQ